jgi:hypothetical protein
MSNVAVYPLQPLNRTSVNTGGCFESCVLGGTAIDLDAIAAFTVCIIHLLIKKIVGMQIKAGLSIKPILAIEHKTQSLHLLLLPLLYPRYALSQYHNLNLIPNPFPGLLAWS